jgi:hypothetical protein
MNIGDFAIVRETVMCRAYDTGEFEHVSIAAGQVVRILSVPARKDVDAFEVEVLGRGRRVYMLAENMRAQLNGSEMVFFGMDLGSKPSIGVEGVWYDGEFVEVGPAKANPKLVTRAPFPDPAAVEYRPKAW